MNVGIWDWSVEDDRVRYDGVMASLFGVEPEGGASGLPPQRFAEAVHPADAALFEDKVAHLLADGGWYVIEYRTCPTPRDLRWVLGRGRFDADAAGRIVRGRGICIDVTESRCDEAAAERDLSAPTPSTALDRAAEHAIAARKAIDAMRGEDGARLRHLADALLWAIGRCLAHRAARLVRSDA